LICSCTWLCSYPAASAANRTSISISPPCACRILRRTPGSASSQTPIATMPLLRVAHYRHYDVCGNRVSALGCRSSAEWCTVTLKDVNLPQRLEWDRIVVATPAYRALEQSGVASKLQGFGIFSEPLCQAGCPGLSRTHSRPQYPGPQAGLEAS